MKYLEGVRVDCLANLPVTLQMLKSWKGTLVQKINRLVSVSPDEILRVRPDILKKV